MKFWFVSGKWHLVKKKHIFENYVTTIYGWSSCQGSFNRHVVNNLGISTKLPLILEKVYTKDTQYYCTHIISKTIFKVNPKQTPVDVCDEPVYTLAKQMQWRFPEQFVNLIYFTLFLEIAY